MRERVLEFAKRIGSQVGTLTYDDMNKEQLIEQLKPFTWNKPHLLIEELQEFTLEVSRGNVEGILDGTIDMQVYLCQIFSWLEKAGVDINGACNAICDNNDSKYTTSIQLAQKWYVAAKEEGKDVVLFDTQVDGVTYFCLKNKDGKVVKHCDFEPVDLSKFIPERLR